jgi:tripartite-type tricarboxylate transporter receptor subunit TctC
MRQPKKSRLETLSSAICLGISVVLLAPAYTFSQAPFYQGKTITMIRSSGSGSVGDMRTRALLPYLRKYIPGSPTIVMEYMPGGGGRKAANYLYASASPDGLTMASMSSSVVSNGILGATGVNYDIDKLIFIGAPMTGSPWVFLTRSKAGFSSLETLSSVSGLRVGSQTVGHVTHIVARLFSYLIGIKDPSFVCQG